MPKKQLSRSHNIAEWYGRDFVSLSGKEVRRLAGVSSPKSMDCPFSGGSCNKKGGVCSLRSYVKDDDGIWSTAGEPVATCPRRFGDGGAVIQWVGEELIGEMFPKVACEVPFLEGIAHGGDSTGTTVGKIDMVLSGRLGERTDWCAVEIQAVYFSGTKMESEFSYLISWRGEGIPAPQGNRHPDFRSSGPKRLMPQLQTKVPTISRWGHKMGVVIDRAFWESLSPMEEVDDVSNCDVAWFVMKFEQRCDGFCLVRDGVHFTTLTRAVGGLTAGKPVALSEFEKDLRSRLDH